MWVPEYGSGLLFSSVPHVCCPYGNGPQCVQGGVMALRMWRWSAVMCDNVTREVCDDIETGAACRFMVQRRLARKPFSPDDLAAAPVPRPNP
eukprot:1964249-Rhodomonas_salina.2